MEYYKLFSDIKSEFSNIGITIGYEENIAASAGPDEVIACFGLHPIGNAWQSIGWDEANKILTMILNRDLAYKHERISYEKAKYYASSFLSLFKRDNARLFTNGTWSTWEESSRCYWARATDSTFDAGVVIISSNGGGILWVEDED